MADSSYRDLNEFINYVRTRGASLNNIFNIEYFFSEDLKTQFSQKLDLDFRNINDSLNLMLENVEIPSVSIATSEYRYNNSPQFKYPYAKIFNQVTMTYILDGTFIQRKLFDVWIDYIYSLSATNSSGGFSNNMRVPYKEEYVANKITIAKFDRCVSPKETGRSLNESINVAHSSYTIENAFPVNISSIPLSNASSDISRVSISFEYDVLRENAVYNGSSITLTANSFIP